MNVLQRLDELIEESRDIDVRAEKLQAAGPLNPASPYSVQEFQRRYRAWYAAALESLPSDLQERFERERAGEEGDCGQAAFAAEPTATGPDRRQVYDARHRETIVPSKLLYTYPHEHCFREPLLRQVRILFEAKHHPEVTRHCELDRRGLLTNLDFGGLHPKVIDAAGTLFADGHYRNAILESCSALAGAIREKSGIVDRDGTPLMQHVFSPKKPVLKVSEDEGERQGLMWLFSGAVMGLRNPRAHHSNDGKDLDAIQAFEWLAFISALMRTVDLAERVETSAATTTSLES